MLPQGASVTVKQPSHLNDFIIKYLSVKSLNSSNLVNFKTKIALLNFFSNGFLMVLCRQTFTKANRPNQNSNLVTAVEGSMTAWIRAVTIN